MLSCNSCAPSVITLGSTSSTSSSCTYIDMTECKIFHMLSSKSLRKIQNIQEYHCRDAIKGEIKQRHVYLQKNATATLQHVELFNKPRSRFRFNSPSNNHSMNIDHCHLDYVSSRALRWTDAVYIKPQELSNIIWTLGIETLYLAYGIDSLSLSLWFFVGVSKFYFREETFPSSKGLYIPEPQRLKINDKRKMTQRMKLKILAATTK